MVLINYLLFLISISYFTFLVTRVVLEKLPINPLFLTGLITIIFLLSKLLLISTKLIIRFYRIYISNQKETTKLKDFLENKVKSLEVYLFEVFYQDFLIKKSFFSLISITFFKVFVKILPNSKVFFFLFLVVPWILFLLVYFLEILTGNFLFSCLYLLSFNFLCRTLLKVAIYCADFEFIRLGKKCLKPNFSLYYGENIVTSFFIANPLIKGHFFFHEPSLQYKSMLIFLWNTFSEIYYFYSAKIFLDFFKNNFKKLISLQMNINLIIFSSSFLLLGLDYFFVLSDLFIVSCLFVSLFSIFLISLDYIVTTQKPLFNDLKDYSSINSFFGEYWMITKIELLQKHCFLSDSDLRPFSVTKSIKQYHKERFQPFQDLLNDKERLFLDGVTEETYTWFLLQVSKDRINFETMTYFPEGQNPKD